MEFITNYYRNYTPAPDILTLTICILFFIIMATVYINKTKSFLYLKSMIYFLVIGSIADILFHIALNHIESVPHLWIYILRSTFHLSLFMIMLLQVLYVKENLQITYHVFNIYFSIAIIGYVVLAGYEIISTVYEFGFYIDELNMVHAGFPIFPFGYIFFLLIMIIMMWRHGQKIFWRIYLGILSSIGLSVAIIIIQQLNKQSSFTAATFLFPIFARMYLIHSNPYDLEIGAVSESAFEDIVHLKMSKKIEMYIMSLYMHDFEGKGRKYPSRIIKIIRQFMSTFFNDATLFHISGGHMILTVDKKKNPDYIANGQKMIDEFYRVYDRLHIDYKIVFTDSFPELTDANDYIGFIKFIHDKIEQNTVVKVTPEDKDAYLKYKKVFSELSDINKCHDLTDKRVLVYCQPVYNINTQTYDTAEALMRLDLPEIGMVYPDVFIPIAEQNQFISTLTKIILFKTCQSIKKLTDEGYKVQRISVNFSVYDFKSDELCSTIDSMIKENGINPKQIAIEITESQNDSDFELIKRRVKEIKKSGVKFYLDDFGTGYSNFERIMEIPFDIVKFDRSLVIAAGNNSRYKTMVSSLAAMFSNMDYSVLYEGVENSDDENRCIGMNANYLQGYKYSKPIPIEKLTEYFSKTSK